MKTKEYKYIEPHEATRIRVHHEGGGAWAIDAADDDGGMTEFNWNRDGHPDAKMTRQRAIERVAEFAASIGLPAGLRIEVSDEPPALVRHRVSVTVEVEVEAVDPAAAIRSAVEIVRDGEGTVVAHEIVK
jgi:hypothetical protein